MCTIENTEQILKLYYAYKKTAFAGFKNGLIHDIGRHIAFNILPDFTGLMAKLTHH